MATYQLQINERTSTGKSILAMLSAIPGVITLEKVKPVAKTEKHSPLYYELQSAFQDVKLMVDGKKPQKTLDEFLAELPDNPDDLPDEV
jgi:hypothetical protein